MKKLYVTYNQNGVVKKAVIDESRYNSLRRSTDVSNLVVYPNELIMENNYNNLSCSDGSCSGRSILNG